MEMDEAGGVTGFPGLPVLWWNFENHGALPSALSRIATYFSQKKKKKISPIHGELPLALDVQPYKT